MKMDANNLPTVKLGDSSNVHIQEPITVIGYPAAASRVGLQILGVESLFVPTVTNGHISAVKADYKGMPVIQSDAAVTVPWSVQRERPSPYTTMLLARTKRPLNARRHRASSRTAVPRSLWAT